jgi:hypothetical protein
MASRQTVRQVGIVSSRPTACGGLALPFPHLLGPLPYELNTARGVLERAVAPTRGAGVLNDLPQVRHHEVSQREPIGRA